MLLNDDQRLVLQVFTRLGAGGPPIQAVSLARGIPRMGYATLLVTGRHDRSHDGDMSYLLRPDDPVHWIPEMSRPVSLRHDLLGFWRLYRLFLRTKPAIVHTHTAKAGVLGRLAARFARVPVVIHTFHGNVFRGYFPPAVSRFVRWTEGLLAGMTDCICVVSEQQGREIAESLGGAARAKIRVIPLGIDLDRLLPMDLPNGESEDFTVGWIGRLVPVKNVPLLVSIAEEVFKRSSRFHFVVAGDGPERQLVENASARFGNTRFTWLGWQRDVASVLAQCHVLVQTSRNEGTPISLIEGMAAGRPFVSTPAGGVVDMVSGSVLGEGKGCRWFGNGVLAEPDPSAFAAAIEDLANDPARLRTMGANAKSFASARYRLHRLLTDLDHVYSELLEAKRSEPALTAVRTAAGS